MGFDRMGGTSYPLGIQDSLQECTLPMPKVLSRSTAESVCTWIMKAASSVEARTAVPLFRHPIGYGRNSDKQLHGVREYEEGDHKD
jgi:hypothetical protein